MPSSRMPTGEGNKADSNQAKPALFQDSFVISKGFYDLPTISITTNSSNELTSVDNYATSPLRLSPRMAYPSANTSSTMCVFRVRISGIQCRNLESKKKLGGKSDPFVQFYWGSLDTVPYRTPVIKSDLNPTYKTVAFQFECKETIDMLKKKKLYIQVFSERTFSQPTLIGRTEVDLYTIATGPVHHDHNLEGCENGRIVFNCYMEQFSHWEIEIKHLGIMIPSMNIDYDRPEGHDYREDTSLSLQKYAITYKCTLGKTETFYCANNLKAPQKMTGEIPISFEALARLKVISSRKSGRPTPLPVALPPAGLHAVNSYKDLMEENNTNSIPPPPSNGDDVDDPIGIDWTSKEEYLPSISKYSTFDELMGATLKLEVRTFIGGRGLEKETDLGFTQMLNAYMKELGAETVGDCKLDPDIKNSILFGQSWLSLEKLFEDALQEKLRLRHYYMSPGASPLSETDDETARVEQDFETEEKADGYTPYISSKFEQGLALKGHQVGVIYGVVVFKKIPHVRQLRSGVISENGITASSSVIVGLPIHKRKQQKVILPEEAQRLLDKMESLFELMSMRQQKDDKEAKIRKATKILKCLQISHKASMLSWVYGSSEALEETKLILLRLWQFLLDNIRVRNYTLRNIFYELLFYLVKRAELSNLPLLGFEYSKNSNSNGMFNKEGLIRKKEHLEFGLKMRGMLLETKFCILQALSIRGVMNNNFMFFVARIISALCFRLPSFGVELYQLWAKSYNETIEEISMEYQIASADYCTTDTLETHLDWRKFHKALYDEYGSKRLKEQESEIEDKYEIVPELCQQRFKRIPDEPNTLNILIVDQWMWNVLDTLAVLNQKIGWSLLPGYAQILKVFFVELKIQKSGPLSPALYKLSCTMLSSYRLINPMSKFLLSRTSVHDVPGVISAIELLGVWMYMIRSWRVRLMSYRLSHLENNDRWNFHQDTQYSIRVGDEVSLLPPSFDYRFLCGALAILLQSEHTQILLTTLEFLYNCWDSFPERHADKLRLELLGVFMQFFLHWSPDVRHFYHTLIALRILKPHGWTQKNIPYVHTPPHSRRHIDAAGADFKSALGTDSLTTRVENGGNSTPRRTASSRSYSSSSIIDTVFRLSSPGRSPSQSPKPKYPGHSPRASPKGKASTLSYMSPKSIPLSPVVTGNHMTGPPFDLNVKQYNLDEGPKARCFSEEVTDLTHRNSASDLTHTMDPSIQLKYHQLIEAVFAAAKVYISKQTITQDEMHVKASWKKKGVLLKQGYLYKTTWKQKFFSLQENRLGYSENEGMPLKRDIQIIGATITELPNQIDQTHGTRLILHNCFSVDNGYQKLVLCAPTYEEAREWIDVLTHNASINEEEEKRNEESTLNMSEFALELDRLGDVSESTAKEVPENLRPYAVLAAKEWHETHRQIALEIETLVNAGLPFTMPALLSKSSTYAEDV